MYVHTDIIDILVKMDSGDLRGSILVKISKSKIFTMTILSFL